MVYINECIDVNTALKNSFKSMSFQEISYAGKPQVVSRYILSNLWCSLSAVFKNTLWFIKALVSVVY